MYKLFGIITTSQETFDYWNDETEQHIEKMFQRE